MAKIQELKIGRYPPAVTVNPETSVIEIIKELSKFRIRHAVVCDKEGKLKGLISARDIINLLGGGERYDKAIERYESLYKAIMQEKALDLMYEAPYFYTDDTLEDVVTIMMERDIGACPVVDSNLYVKGIISEKHIMALFSDASIYIPVKKIMSSPIITLPPQATLIEGQKTMIENDIRRLVLKGVKRIKSTLTLIDIVSYYARDEILGKLEENRVSEVHKKPLQLIPGRKTVYVSPETDLGKAIKLMRENKTGFLIVGEGEGIVTERDFLLKIPRIMGVEVFVNEAKKLIVPGLIHF